MNHSQNPLAEPLHYSSTGQNPGNAFVAGILRVLALFSALTLLALFIGVLCMLSVGHWLVKQDNLQKADAIAVLSGGFPARALEAASLYREGYAREIWLTNPVSDAQKWKSLGLHFPGEADFNSMLLRRQGIPAKAIHVLDSPIVNTADELDVISSALQKQGENSVIVVTNKAHTRRVHTLWSKYNSTHGTAIVRGIADDDFDPDAWWKSTEDTHQVIHEVMGMMNVWAGMPMRTRFRTQSPVGEVHPRRSIPLPEANSPAADPVEWE